MSGHKHKSALGSNRKVTAPPDSHHGKPWWTVPPTVLPLQEHIEYATEFRAQLIRRTASNAAEDKELAELRQRVKAWLRAANRLVYSQPVLLADLGSDDEYIVAANHVIGAMFSEAAKAGVTLSLDPRHEAWRRAVEQRARAARDRLQLREVSTERFKSEVRR